MDCKSPIAMLADVSARKVQDTASRLNMLVDTPAAPNFDEYADSPRLGRIGESPFLGLNRRFPDQLLSASPQVGGFGESPFVSGSRRQVLDSPQPSSLGRTSAPLESPQISEARSAVDLVKASPRMAVLVQAATCSESDKNKKKRQPPNPERKSEYRGVSWQKTSKAWVAQYKSGGKTTYLGLFATEEEAARAYDVAVFLKGGKNLNFGVPSEEVLNQYRLNGNIPAGRLGATVSKKTVVEDRIRIISETQPSADAATAAALAKHDKGATSNYRGVSWYAARQIWKASIQVNRKKEYIGRFETEEEAARAYNKRAIQLRGKDAILNVVPETVTRYPPGTIPLSAEELAAIEAKEREKKDKKDKKRQASALEASTSSSSSSASSGTVHDTDEERKPKKAKTSHGDKRSSSTQQQPSTSVAATPDLARTPMLTRKGENTSRNLVPPLAKPSFNEDDEVRLAMRNVDFPFDSPQFMSPLPQTNLKRPFTAGFTAPSTSQRFPVVNNGNFTPMLQNLFDSPFLTEVAGAFTPSADSGLRNPDFTAPTNRKGRKSLAAPYS